VLLTYFFRSFNVFCLQIVQGSSSLNRQLIAAAARFYEPINS
jgi:hypothetical protein